MATLGDLVEGARHYLSGFDSSKDAVSALAEPLSAAATTFPLASVDNATSGICEVDLEQMRVRSVDPQSASATVWPFGRGYRGTTAAAHAAGTEVRFNPTWPASTVAAAINAVLIGVYPMLYAVRPYVTQLDSWQAVDVPADATGIIAVYREDPIYPDQWVREDAWSFSRDSSAVGRPLRIGGANRLGRVRIVYSARPTLFSLPGAMTQDFVATTGLDERHADLLTLGVAARLAPFIDVSRLSAVTAAAVDAGAARQQGAALTATKLLVPLFQQRLEQEAGVLRKEHPIFVHRS
jgi:hypothetical protein